MPGMNLTEAFARYGAKLTNRQWAFSAIAEDGSLVLSCWQHKITGVENNVWRYEDNLSRLKQQASGRSLLEQHLVRATNEQIPVHIVIVSTRESDVVDSGADASKVKKEFDTRMDRVGRVVSFDGDTFVIEFKQEKIE